MAFMERQHKLIRNKKGQTLVEFALLDNASFRTDFCHNGHWPHVFCKPHHAACCPGRGALCCYRQKRSHSGQRAAIIQQISNKSLGIYPKYCSPPKFSVWSGTSETFISGTCSNNPGKNCATNADCTSPGTCIFPSSVGAPKDIIIISVDCSWPILLTPFLKKGIQ